jgi:NarL family two-component system response regulator LiaR
VAVEEVHVKKILIVDDHPSMRAQLHKRFDAQRDLTVCGEAQNGQDAIHMALELHPDLIVLDNYMPLMSGIDAAEALKKILPSVRILLLTAFKSKFSEVYAAAAGADAIASKYDDFNSILAQIRGLLQIEVHP